MSTCTKHEKHSYQHHSASGRLAITHAGHTDYLHDGHLHHPHAEHVDRQVLEVGASNPDRCAPDHVRGRHDKNRTHGRNCSQQPVPHGDHLDDLAGDDLFYFHGDDRHEHGPVILAPRRYCVPRGALGFWCAGGG